MLCPQTLTASMATYWVGRREIIETKMAKKTLSNSENFQRLAYAVGFLYRGTQRNIGPSDICQVLFEVTKNAHMNDSSYKDNFRKYFDAGKMPPNNKNGEAIFLAIKAACSQRELKAPRSYDVDLEGIGFSNEIIYAVEDKLNPKRQQLNYDGVPFAVDVHIDPLDIDAQVRNRTTGELKAHLLYQSPVAAALWDKVKTSPFYPLHNACAKGLNYILRQKSWADRCRNFDAFFILGVGAWAKDKLILQYLRSSSSKQIAYVWVDASFEMLRRTIKEKVNSQDSFPNVRFAAMRADFEYPSKLRKLYMDNFLSFPEFSKKKVFFILGFTLSNLNESRFFVEYSTHCQQGDLFVFPMQFIPDAAKKDSDALEKFKSNLLSSYQFDEGTELAQAGFGFLQSYSLKRFLGAEVSSFAFYNTSSSLTIKFSADLESNHDNLVTRVITAQSSRHYKSDYLDFLKKFGFELIDCSPEYDGAQTLLVEYVGMRSGSGIQSVTKELNDDFDKG